MPSSAFPSVVGRPFSTVTHAVEASMSELVDLSRASTERARERSDGGAGRGRRHMGDGSVEPTAAGGGGDRLALPKLHGVCGSSGHGGRGTRATRLTERAGRCWGNGQCVRGRGQRGIRSALRRALLPGGGLGRRPSTGGGRCGEVGTGGPHARGVRAGGGASPLLITRALTRRANHLTHTVRLKVRFQCGCGVLTVCFRCAYSALAMRLLECAICANLVRYP